MSSVSRTLSRRLSFSTNWASQSVPKYYTSVHTKPRVFRSHTQFTLSESLPQQQHRNGISRVGSSLPPVTYSDIENDNENVSDGSIRYCCSPACKIVLASILGVPSQTMVRSGCWMRGTSFGGGHGLAQIIMMKQDKVVTGGIISHPQVVMNADASLTGWGCAHGPPFFSGSVVCSRTSPPYQCA